MTGESEDAAVITDSGIASPLVDLIPELLDIVFECVYAGDRRAIFACSLVSPYWEAVSRPQRFRRMSFYIGEDFINARWEAFVASPGLARAAPWTRELVLIFGKNGNKSIHCGFLTALPLMPHIHTLELRGVFSRYPGMYYDRASTPSTHKITRLTLFGPPRFTRPGRDDPPFALFDVLRLFPSILRLEIRRLRSPFPKDQATQELQEIPRPKTLVVQYAALGCLLQATNISADLRSLTWNGRDDSPTDLLLPAVALKLEFLEVSTATPLRLHEFPKLRHLTLHGYDSTILLTVPDFDRGAPQWASAAAVLATAPRTLRLRSFHFIVKVERSDYLSQARNTMTKEVHSVRSMEESLVRLATEGELRGVAFEMQRGYDEFVAAPDLFATAFPRLVELGLLTDPPYDTHATRVKLNVPPQSLAGW